MYIRTRRFIAGISGFLLTSASSALGQAPALPEVPDDCKITATVRLIKTCSGDGCRPQDNAEEIYRCTGIKGDWNYHEPQREKYDNCDQWGSCSGADIIRKEYTFKNHGEHCLGAWIGTTYHRAGNKVVYSWEAKADVTITHSCAPPPTPQPSPTATPIANNPTPPPPPPTPEPQPTSPPPPPPPPTQEPTVAPPPPPPLPTLAPTRAPTVAPTRTPRATPTRRATASPTPRRTATPRTSPTPRRTATPTRTPTPTPCPKDKPHYNRQTRDCQCMDPKIGKSAFIASTPVSPSSLFASGNFCPAREQLTKGRLLRKLLGKQKTEELFTPINRASFKTISATSCMSQQCCDEAKAAMQGLKGLGSLDGHGLGEAGFISYKSPRELSVILASGGFAFGRSPADARKSMNMPGYKERIAYGPGTRNHAIRVLMPERVHPNGDAAFIVPECETLKIADKNRAKNPTIADLVRIGEEVNAEMARRDIGGRGWTGNWQQDQQCGEVNNKALEVLRERLIQAGYTDVRIGMANSEDGNMILGNGQHSIAVIYLPGSGRGVIVDAWQKPRRVVPVNVQVHSNNGFTSEVTVNFPRGTGGYRPNGYPGAMTDVNSRLN